MKKMNRRNFFKLTAVAGSSVVVASGLQALLDPQSASAANGRLTTSGQDTIIPGVCGLCSSGCGILARVADGNVVKLEGSPMHPINQGALCPKGQAAPELLYNPDRLTAPQKRVGERGEGKWQEISWEEAATITSERIQAARQAGHSEGVGFMYGDTRGQQRSFFERFMQAIGSPNFISRESLNMAASKLGVFLTQGLYAQPVYDLENSNYILSFGASLLEAGSNPQRMISGFSYGRRGRANRSKVVVIDPRQGVTGAKADEWIPINPGTDAALALGIACVIIQSNLFDSEFVHNYSFGFNDFLGDGGKTIKGFKSFVLDGYDPKKVEQITGVPATTIARIAGEFATNLPAVAIIPGKGGLLNGSMEGVYAAMAIHMLNALVGSLEAPGGVLTQQYFPVKAWPDLGVDQTAKQGLLKERVDGAGKIFPLARHAYQSVADQVLSGYALDTLFLYDANPVFELPGGQKFVEALKQIPFSISFSSFMDESALYADLVLPEPTFLERWGDDYIEGLGYPGIALRQPVIDPLYNNLNTVDFLLQVTEKLGGGIAKAFPWKTYEEVLQFRLADIGASWDTLKELCVWLVPGYRFAKRGSPRWVSDVIGRDRLNSPQDGYFDFYSRELFALFGKKGKSELEKLGFTQPAISIPIPHHETVNMVGDAAEYPYLLNVITLMSLGPKSEAANLPTLQEISGMTVGETWDSWLEMNPQTARGLGLKDKDPVWVESPSGKLKTKVRLVKGLRPDVVNMPYNQGHSAVGRFAQGRGANAMDLLSPASEPVSGLASFTNTQVKVSRA